MASIMVSEMDYCNLGSSFEDSLILLVSYKFIVVSIFSIKTEELERGLGPFDLTGDNVGSSEEYFGYIHLDD